MYCNASHVYEVLIFSLYNQGTEIESEEEDEEADEGKVEDFMKTEQAKLEEEKKALLENQSMVAGVRVYFECTN